MVKKVYHISGFDCPNCAAKTEAHLNRNKNISYVRLDFSANRMYITYKDKAYSEEELLKLINEVESDPITLFETNGGFEKVGKIFNKNMWVLSSRVIISIILIVLLTIFFKDNALINIIGYGVICLILLYDIFYKLLMHIVHGENIIDHNLLICISSIGAFALASFDFGIEEMEAGLFDEHFEAAMVVLLFQIGRIIENIATNKSKAAVMSAVELRVDYANLILNNEIIKVKPESLSINDRIVVTAGELIPVDGEVITGDAYVDTSSLNGEYVPLHSVEGDKVCGGCLIKSGTLTILVNKKYEDSTVAKIIELISQGGEKKSKADEFIAKFAKWYTPIVCGLALLTFLIGGLIPPHNWLYFLYLGLEILVTGCPCAIVISVPLAYFSAVGLASKNGIVVKGTNYLDELVNMGKLVTDKTGTLTHGSFSIQKISPNGMDEEKFLNYLYAAECLSTHPIGKAICHGKNFKRLASEQKKFQEIAGLGVTSIYKGEEIMAGSKTFFNQKGIDVEDVKENGTIIYCAVNNLPIGYVILADEIKEDAQPMVDLLHSEDVEIILLTGDKEENAKEICQKLGIDRWHSELMPDEKTNILEQEMSNTKKSVAFIGDGINDSPSIIRSDIGIAMGGIGSDITVENADIVIMNDDPAKVYDALRIAKMARSTSIFNIAFALFIKALVAVLVLIPNVTIPMYLAVLADTGLTVLLVVNSLLLLYRKVKRKI